MYRSLIVCAALFAFMGCSTGEVKLGVDVAPIKVAYAESLVADSSGRSDLEFSRVRLLVGHAKVGYAGRGCGSDESDVGPNVVDLSADEIANGAHREFSLGALPSGTYGGAEIEIKPIEADQDASDDVFADFRSSGASVLVDGLFQGKPFTFAGHFLAEQGTDGEVEVDEAKPLAIAMTVDTSSWFKDANDATLDPTDAAQHDALAVAICKTLDTQPQMDNAPKRTKHGGPPGGGHGSAPLPHCVEAAP